MHWSLFVALAASMNAINNYGFKTHARKNILLLGALAFGTASVAMAAIVLVRNPQAVQVMLASPKLLMVALAMGLLTPVFFGMMFKAFANRGPISLVDPLWACIYTFVSFVIGIGFLAESPSLMAASGAALYVIGAAFMARG